MQIGYAHLVKPDVMKVCLESVHANLLVAASQFFAKVHLTHNWNQYTRRLAELNLQLRIPSSIQTILVAEISEISLGFEEQHRMLPDFRRDME